MLVLRLAFCLGHRLEQAGPLARESAEATMCALGVPANAVAALYVDIAKHDRAGAGEGGPLYGGLCSDAPVSPAATVSCVEARLKRDGSAR